MAFPLTVSFTLTSTVPPDALWRGLATVDQWPTVIATMRSAKLEPKGACTSVTTPKGNGSLTPKSA